VTVVSNEIQDFNATITAEFGANAGQVGGMFETPVLVLERR
jgi:hypothetical protein